MADITFGTNNEYGFDYLRDNMSISPEDLVQRKHHFAIVDEVDSVLIDDARTPLIISGPVPKGEDQMFEQYRGAVENLFNLQRNLVTQLLADAKKLISEGKTDEAATSTGGTFHSSSAASPCTSAWQHRSCAPNRHSAAPQLFSRTSVCLVESWLWPFRRGSCIRTGR